MRNILVVDDDKEITYLTSTYLQAEGFKISCWNQSANREYGRGSTESGVNGHVVSSI
ncbi:hypothetical protein [Alicyclobacillus fodiniaquatilis]|uniref:Response regulator receiver domain-containing protein n=1 Tax=Alicyclobacillus fodiniaquatilis TaxID=1661150 RepID=A0ABW4JS42_9BACL